MALELKIIDVDIAYRDYSIALDTARERRPSIVISLEEAQRIATEHADLWRDTSQVIERVSERSLKDQVIIGPRGERILFKNGKLHPKVIRQWNSRKAVEDLFTDLIDKPGYRQALQSGEERRFADELAMINIKYTELLLNTYTYFPADSLMVGELQISNTYNDGRSLASAFATARTVKEEIRLKLNRVGIDPKISEFYTLKMFISGLAMLSTYSYLNYLDLKGNRSMNIDFTALSLPVTAKADRDGADMILETFQNSDTPGRSVFLEVKGITICRTRKPLFMQIHSVTDPDTMAKLLVTEHFKNNAETPSILQILSYTINKLRNTLLRNNTRVRHIKNQPHLWLVIVNPFHYLGLTKINKY